MKRSLKGVALSIAAGVLGWAAASAPAADTTGTPPAKTGVVSHINVLSNHVQDVSSLEAWKKNTIKEGMTDNQKLIAIWETVIRHRHQTSPPEELLGDGTHDPMKTIHVYGYGMCCCASSNIQGFARYLGYETRGRIIKDHSVPEVRGEQGWRLLDASVMNYFIKPDGQIAGVDDIRAAVNGWWTDPANADIAKKARGIDSEIRKLALNGGWKKGPALLANCQFYNKDTGLNDAGWHGWPSTMQEYDFPDPNGPNKKKDLGAVYDYGSSMGYELNVQLRPGEKITRNWFHKGLHVNMRGGGAPDDLLAIKEGGKRPAFLGLQERLGDHAPGRIGNGTVEYHVPLADGTFRSGAMVAENLAAKSEGAACGVAAKDAAKPGVLVIRMPSSYVYLGGSLKTTAVVAGGGSITVFFSDNHGLDWTQIAEITASGEKTTDLGKYNFNRYDYRLKFEIKGAGTGLDSILISNDFQHSQAPLPLLRPGKNTITFDAGKPEGTITIEPNVQDPDGVKGKQLSYVDFHATVQDLEAKLLRVGGSGKGSITFDVQTPGEMTRIRTNSHYRCRDLNGNDYWEVEASFDDGKTWEKLGKMDKGQPASSKYIVFEKVPAGVTKAKVRYTAKQKNTVCMFGLRIDADYKEPAGGFVPVKVTHVWTEGGETKKVEHVAAKPQDTWEIECGPTAVSKSFIVEVAK